MTWAYTEGRPTWAGPLPCSRGDAIDNVRFATFRVGDRVDAPYALFVVDHYGATMPSRRLIGAGNENGPPVRAGRLVVLHMGRGEENRGSEVPAHKITGSTAAQELPATSHP